VYKKEVFRKMVDFLSDALNSIKVAELKGKSTCTAPNSKLVVAVLTCLKDNGYLASVEPKEKKIAIKLSGKINNCGAIKPRFFVKYSEWDKYENRFLPSRTVGLIFVSTSSGLMTHIQAKEKRLGGALLAFVY
ncbi:MAG: 30S ribosomal protein S8, partial [Candidatus Micrarchaeota archaeon]